MTSVSCGRGGLQILKQRNNGSPRDAHRLAALDHITNLYSIISSSGNVLAPASYKQVVSDVDLFLLHPPGPWAQRRVSCVRAWKTESKGNL